MGMPRTSTVFLIHLCATLFMTGVIWVIQVVHYPLFARVGNEGYAAYQAEHEQRITWIVGPVMLVELATAIYLVGAGAAGFSRPALLVNLALLALIWLSTFFLQVPQHQRLEQGFDPRAIQLLVQTNWIRTILWSARSILLATLIRTHLPK